MQPGWQLLRYTTILHGRYTAGQVSNDGQVVLGRTPQTALTGSIQDITTARRAVWTASSELYQQAPSGAFDRALPITLDQREAFSVVKQTLEFEEVVTLIDTRFPFPLVSWRYPSWFAFELLDAATTLDGVFSAMLANTTAGTLLILADGLTVPSTVRTLEWSVRAQVGSVRLAQNGLSCLVSVCFASGTRTYWIYSRDSARTFSILMDAAVPAGQLRRWHTFCGTSLYGGVVNMANSPTSLVTPQATPRAVPIGFTPMIILSVSSTRVGATNIICCSNNTSCALLMSTNLTAIGQVYASAVLTMLCVSENGLFLAARGSNSGTPELLVAPMPAWPRYARVM